ncbi:MAG: hypothetical protein ABR555_18040 [Pyrinomonadaceae bacterium]
MRKTLLFALVLLSIVAVGQNSLANELTEALARKAVSERAAESAPAIAELRAMGPTGLKTLLDRYTDDIKQHIDDPTLGRTPDWDRIANALDAVSQQKDSYLSGLYWYTDLREAQKVAAASGKPILSLRLLGNLNDEFSCANSRFFRTVLYSNADVSAMLRQHFVLHWQSVRPAPRVTIDFGDGRKLERTITGNSIHYVLDSDGRPIDALPGLYGPQAFLKALMEAELITEQVRANGVNRQQLLANYQRSRLAKISTDWVTDTTKIGGQIPEGFAVEKNRSGEAISIAPLAVTKALTEASILRSITAGTEALGRITDEAAWNKIASLHATETKLDARSISLIRRQVRGMADAGPALDDLLKKFQQSIALDTVRNEYLLHSKVYSWLLNDRNQMDVDRLNEKVYAELFLTPRSDQWLGLFSANVYTALDNNGVVEDR